MRRRRRTVASLFALGGAVAVVGLLFSGVTQAAPPDPATVGFDTVSSIALNGVSGTTLTVAPGADVSISADWSDSHPSYCGGCIDFLDVGFAGDATPAGCLENSGYTGDSGSGTVDLGDAPTAPGTYDIWAEYELEYYCGEDWNPSGSGAAVIAQVTVLAGPPTATIGSPGDGQIYALGQHVPTGFTCADPTGPGIASCLDSNGSGNPGTLDTSTTGTFNYTVTATSTDGQTASTTIHYTVAEPPTATISAPADDQTYNMGQHVGTSFSCQESATGPGIASCLDSNASGSPGTLDTSAPGTFAYTVTATSKDGGTATATINYTVVGPPTATIDSPADGQTYAPGQHVATSFACADATNGPGIATCVDSNDSASPGTLDTSTLGKFAYSVTATSTDGQTGTATINYTVAEPPTATINSPADGQTYNLGQHVTTGFACVDGTDGPGIASCVDSNGSASPGALDTSAAGTFAYSVTATSKDGQAATATIHYTVVGPPTATISAPADHQTYALDEHVPTGFTCADATNGPGIATCADSNGSASPGVLNTSATGTFAYSVTATSTDGQTGTATINYTVAGPPKATITTPADGATYNLGQHAPTAFACADPTGPGIASCLDSNGSASPGVLDTSTPGTFAYSVTAISSDGQATTATIHYTVYGPPTATIASPADGDTYAIGEHVPTTFACADPTGPGIATCLDSNGGASPGVLDTSTVGTFAYSVTATSTDGQATTATIHYTVAGPPTATITTPAGGGTYNLGQHVPTAFACADPTGPGIAICVDSSGGASPGVLDTSTAGTFAYSVTATSADGQATTATIHYTVAGPPTATIAAPADDQTYARGEHVPTTFACADPTGPGIATCLDSNGSTSAGTLDTSTTGTFAYSVTATSTDGQTTTATVHYTVAGPPTAVISSPADAQTFNLGQHVPTAFACADPTGPGIASCLDATASASPGVLDTSTTGTFAYTVTANSTDGQTASTTIHYSVAPPPTPVIGPAVLASSTDLSPVGGTVTIKLPGSSTFTSVSSTTNVPLGSTIDAQSGTVSLTVALPGGGSQTGEFYDGEFVLTQSQTGTLVETLAGSSFAGCPTAPNGIHGGARDAAAKKKPTTVVRQLWGNAHGKYTTKGRYGSASVSGTVWVTEDLCDGTLIRAIKDNVFVVAFAHRHKRHNVRQGQSFFIPAPGYFGTFSHGVRHATRGLSSGQDRDIGPGISQLSRLFRAL
ncbi:MAG: hypothetical protein ABR946_03290 [Solirubrobacteraceae bacterium]